MMDANRGFTLIELMVTLAIAAILLTIAVPNFTAFVQNNRLVGQTNDLVTMLTLARSEAIRRNGPVTVCARGSDTACAGGSNWDGGFLVFADANADGAVDAGEEILRVRQTLEGGNTLRSGASTVTFRANGIIGVADVVFRLCDARGAADARTIEVSSIGRSSTSVGVDACP